ncbi:MAG TPA: flippase [Candidatus Eisenbacteria bacterium]|jgi:PST family polysaccharide transporter
MTAPERIEPDAATEKQWARTRRWIERLRRQLRALIPGQERLIELSSTTGWAFMDRILRMAANTVFAILLARWYGPHEYGRLIYAVALVGLFSGLSSMGLEPLILRDLVQYPERASLLKGTGFALKLIGAAAAALAAVGTLVMLPHGDQGVLVLVALTAAGVLFQSFDVIDLWFQARLQYRRSVFARLPAFALAMALKFGLLVARVPLWAIALASTFELALAASALLLGYRRAGGRVVSWKASRSTALALLATGWPLGVSSLMMLVYMRIDQVMIANMLDHTQTGLYSVAVKLSEVWYLIPTTLVPLIFPLIVAARATDPDLYYRRLQKLYIYVTWMALAVAVVVSLTSSWLVDALYGRVYHDAARVLSVNIWAAVFGSQGVARGYWLVAENLQRFSVWYVAVGAAANILLNLILIGPLGILGAACATLVSQALVAVIVPLFIRETRRSATMLMKAFFLRF